ncbi:MAG: cation diffusion facilitator family transporter [Candidatus Cloacimonetes bacterium]|nr:cation diffusion facilitator family transporter [Candidatus Cloacimonadota bacterium]MCF7813264.1 cation diffusion facilitator family transporter [Candidatus Cloacimonadota bacterium]MCF7867339.1 cation diffusion facilitator family transporter [Candidatus Cloacimonadota bacterium]MCF7882773.1 cation diffusion facilitator family transporter [Candidatus Cloacimonadota bacterium]
MKNAKTQIGYLQAIISVIINILLFAVKLWAGIKSASIAIIADAWHTLSDSFSSFLLIIGFKISSKPADEKHPFGHGRAEIIFSVIVGTILAVIGVNFLVESIERLKSVHSAQFGLFAYIATIVSILAKEGMAQFAIRMGKKHNSYLLIADGWHHRSDAISSIIILIGIILGKYFWWIDGILGILMAFLLFYAAYDVLKNSISHLIGEEPSDDLICEIVELIRNKIAQPVYLHHLHVHYYGDHREVTFHIEMNPDLALKEVHTVMDEIENLLRVEMNIEATIHAEPYSLPDSENISEHDKSK